MSMTTYALMRRGSCSARWALPPRCRLFSRAWVLVALTACTGSAALCAQDPPAQAPSQAVLHLANGGFAPGEIKDSPPGILRWQCPMFTSPFTFAINQLSEVRFPAPGAWPEPAGDLCFELASGDTLFGSLVELDATSALVDTSQFGRIHVQRSAVHRINRWRNSAELIYNGPNGLHGWQEAPAGKKRGWREESGRPVSDKDGTSLFANLGLPARSAIELELSWKNKPDFVLALGVSDDEESARQAFHFEVWGHDLVVTRELESEADVGRVKDVATGSGHLHMQVYLDQERARMLVFSTDAHLLADLTVSEGKPRVLPGVHLANVRGDLKLERLRISRWNGEPPTAPRPQSTSR
ncbi:MAG TPA: hypothetical protein VGY53_09370, partial [Isosphaeraceae bacterium]|nr:hypothetical protein [Isosphaeraceae bacterium]